MDAFHAFFESIGIAYEVVYRFDALKTLYCPVDTQNLWRQHSKETTNSQAVSGENNPMFGISHRESTKRLIGEKAAKEKGAIPKNKGLSKKTLIKFKIIEEPENGEIKINYDYK